MKEKQRETFNTEKHKLKKKVVDGARLFWREGGGVRFVRLFVLSTFVLDHSKRSTIPTAVKEARSRPQ